VILRLAVDEYALPAAVRNLLARAYKRFLRFRFQKSALGRKYLNGKRSDLPLMALSPYQMEALLHLRYFLRLNNTVKELHG
jgi:hypothetical protein